MEYQWQLGLKTRIFGNFSWQSNKNEQGVKDMNFGPKRMFKLGITHKINDKVLVNLFHNYNSPQSDLSSVLEITSINPRPNSQNLLTANLSYRFDLAYGFNKTQPVTVSLHLDNVLNEKHNVANMRHRSSITSIPGNSERQVFLSLESFW